MGVWMGVGGHLASGPMVSATRKEVSGAGQGSVSVVEAALLVFRDQGCQVGQSPRTVGTSLSKHRADFTQNENAEDRS